MSETTPQHGPASGGHGGGNHHGGSHPPHGGGHEAHEEGVPEWMISFADNALLQMGFFVILLAITLKQMAGMSSSATGPSAAKANEKESQKQSQKASPDIIDAAIALRSAFNSPVNLESKDPRDLPLIQRLIDRQARGEGEEEGPKGNGQRVQSIRPTDYRALSGAVYFDENTTAVAAQDKETLSDIANHIRGLRLVVEVRGHSSAAEAFYQPDQAMRLSFERSLAVAEVLVQKGLDWRQLRLIGSGDNDRLRPVVYTKAEQRQNQRVEVVVTNELIATQ